MKGLGDQGIVASVCPAQTNDITRKDYGYAPAVGAIIDRLKTKLGVQCLPRVLTPVDGKLPCVMIEARKATGVCCDPKKGRFEVSDEHAQAKVAAQQDKLSQVNGFNCFCEILPAKDEAQRSCQNDIVPEEGADGWCYVDATTVPQTGNPELVKDCASSEKRLLRFVGNAKVSNQGVVFINCSE